MQNVEISAWVLKPFTVIAILFTALTIILNCNYIYFFPLALSLLLLFKFFKYYKKEFVIPFLLSLFFDLIDISLLYLLMQHKPHNLLLFDFFLSEFIFRNIDFTVILIWLFVYRLIFYSIIFLTFFIPKNYEKTKTYYSCLNLYEMFYKLNNKYSFMNIKEFFIFLFAKKNFVSNIACDKKKVYLYTFGKANFVYIVMNFVFFINYFLATKYEYSVLIADFWIVIAFCMIWNMLIIILHKKYYK